MGKIVGLTKEIIAARKKETTAKAKAEKEVSKGAEKSKKDV